LRRRRRTRRRRDDIFSIITALKDDPT